MLICKLDGQKLIPVLLLYKIGTESNVKHPFYTYIPESLKKHLSNGNYVILHVHTHPSDQKVKYPTTDDRPSIGDKNVIENILKNGFSTIGLLMTRLGLILYDENQILTAYKKIEPKKLKSQEIKIEGEKFYLITSNLHNGGELKFKIPYKLTEIKI